MCAIRLWRRDDNSFTRSRMCRLALSVSHAGYLLEALILLASARIVGAWCRIGGGLVRLLRISVYCTFFWYLPILGSRE